MTLSQTALIRTIIFVMGTVALGTVAALAFTHYPEATTMTLLIGFFAYITYLYYGITKSRLEWEAERVQRALRD